MRSVLVLTLVLLVSAPTYAFKFRLTSGGDLVKWRASEITIHLDPSLGDLASKPEVEQAVISAFTLWKTEAELPMNFSFVHASCATGYTPGGGNTNCVSASTQTTGSEDAGGTTSVSFSQKNGEIVDADIVFFVDAGDWSLEQKEGTLNLVTVTLHEIGHLIGLAHSSFITSIMYPMTDVNSSRAPVLSDDDIWGATALYDSGESDGSGCSIYAPGKNKKQPNTSLLNILLL